jgi:hypothetical protein
MQSTAEQAVTESLVTPVPSRAPTRVRRWPRGVMVAGALVVVGSLVAVVASMHACQP